MGWWSRFTGQELRRLRSAVLTLDGSVKQGVPLEDECANAVLRFVTTVAVQSGIAQPSEKDRLLCAVFALGTSNFFSSIYGCDSRQVRGNVGAELSGFDMSCTIRSAAMFFDLGERRSPILGGLALGTERWIADPGADTLGTLARHFRASAEALAASVET